MRHNLRIRDKSPSLLKFFTLVQGAVDYEQSFFLLGPSSKTPETRKWPLAWLKAQDGRGRLPPSFLASNARARALPLLNLKKKRGCSQYKGAEPDPGFSHTLFSRSISVRPLEPGHLEEDYPITTFFKNKRVSRFFANGPITLKILKAASWEAR